MTQIKPIEYSLNNVKENEPLIKEDFISFLEMHDNVLMYKGTSDIKYYEVQSCKCVSIGKGIHAKLGLNVSANRITAQPRQHIINTLLEEIDPDENNRFCVGVPTKLSDRYYLKLMTMRMGSDIDYILFKFQCEIPYEYKRTKIF